MSDDERVKTGVPEIDTMLNGGLIPKRPYIVSGPPGSGKTIFCFQFLLEGLKKRERVLYVALEEPPNEIRSNIEAFGWNVSGVSVLDANPDIMNLEPTPIMEISTKSDIVKLGKYPDEIRKSDPYNPYVVTIHSLQNALEQLFKKYDISRLVIDSVTALRFFCIASGDEGLYIQSFLRFLSEAKVTVLLTVETPETFDTLPEIFLARGEIRFHKHRAPKGIERWVSVEKIRGSGHDVKRYPMRIEAGKGIIIDLPEF